MEDFIFDDDVDEVGAEVEANCPKCKADTTHVVISKYEDEIRRVQCNPCGDVHAYRKPRGEAEEEAEPEKPKKKVKAKPTWEQVMAKSKKQPKPYAIGEYFKEMEVLSHPKFGVGYITENIGDDKIEVTFQTDKRVLIHNRKNLTLPFLRPLNLPTPKKGKAGKAPAAAKPMAAPAPAKPSRGQEAGGGQAGREAGGQVGPSGRQARCRQGEEARRHRPQEARQVLGPPGVEEAVEGEADEGREEVPLARPPRPTLREPRPSPAPRWRRRRDRARRLGPRACARRASARPCAPSRASRTDAPARR
jgi:hypothetical protein